MGKWVHQSEINRKDWDTLVRKSKFPSIFSFAYYIDATAENWYAYADEGFNYAIPVAYTEKLGVKSVYPPFYHRSMCAIGDIDKIDWNNFESELLSQFPRGSYHFEEDFLTIENKEKLVYQTLNKRNFKLKDIANRNLKKFDKSDFKLKTNVDGEDLTNLIVSQLSEKLDFYNSNESKSIFALVKKAEMEGSLITVGIKKGHELVGGLLALHSERTILYLKGACTEESMNKGAMYAAMNQLITSTFEKNYSFDFGGSRIEGVRFFNTRFSGSDEIYYKYAWENGPIWFKTLQQLRKWIKK
jgi:hypothetical protein